MNKNIICAGVFFICMAIATPVYAIPTLGVATDTGIYAYTDPDALTDEYIDYFADIILPAVGDYEGFVIGPSGSSLTIFTSYNPSATLIYLLADTAGHHRPMTFGGVELIYDGDNNPQFIEGQADGYTDIPYFYTALTNIVDYYWQLAPDDFPKEDGKTFWFYTAPITYMGDWTPGYYLFAAAEINGDTPGLQFSGSESNDKFSPKTASAGGVPIPEPTTVLLLSSGIFGLIIFSRTRTNKE